LPNTTSWENCWPDNPVAFLSRYETLAIHSTLPERFGGPSGVRDFGLVESALYRPGTGHYADLAEMAAALFESLIMNHPFVDGNKRVAFFATDVFLSMNCYQLKVDANKAHRFLIGTTGNESLQFRRIAAVDSQACGKDELSRGSPAF
jgi:death-on-curing protein